MAPEKEGSRTRRKAGVERSDSGSPRHRAEKKAGQDSDVTMVDVDPWGSFFEKLWEQAAEGESADRDVSGRAPAKGTPTAGAKSGRRRRSPRAS